MADGIFTPAVSVTSAVGGMAVAKASINKDVIPVSIVCSVLADRRPLNPCFQAFLVVLFLLQQFGTHRIGFLFAPST